MKNKVFLSEEDKSLSLEEIADKYNISRSTAWRARKRGWFIPKYHEMEDPNIGSDINAKELYEIAESVYIWVILPLQAFSNISYEQDGLSIKSKDKYPYSGPEWKQDLIQEAVFAMLRRSGDKARDRRSYLWTVAKFAMLDFARSGKTKARIVG